MNKKIVLYILTGIGTTIVNILVFLLLDLFQVDYKLSTVLAWFFSVVFAYITNKIWVFESTDNSLVTIIKQMNRFFSARILSLIIDLIFMFIFVSIFHIESVLAKVLINIFVVLVNYFLSKMFVFK